MKVRCGGCKQFVAKEGCVRVGLGWCCDAECRQLVFRRNFSSREEPAKPQLTNTTKAGVKLRDRHKCRFCGADRNLHVHHLAYRSEGGCHDDWNLMTLCWRCHDKVHSNKRVYKPLLEGTLWMQYYNNVWMTVPQYQRWLEKNT